MPTEKTSTKLRDQRAITVPWAEQFPLLVAAQSTRHGGVTPGSLGSLNLGWYTDDRPENVRENYRRLGADLDFDPTRIAAGYQVHGTQVLRVAAPGQAHGYDAFATDQPGIVLSVSVADCTPVLLFDPQHQVVAAAHAGWRGTVANIVGSTLAAMQAWYGTDPGDCFAYIGTCIAYADYQVDTDVADHFPAGHRRWDERAGKFYVDLKGANRDHLLQAGLAPEHIAVSTFSTHANAGDFFSHRAEKGRAGRGIALIGRKG